MKSIFMSVIATAILGWPGGSLQAAPEAFPSLAQVRAYKTPALDTKAVQVTNQTVTLGNLTLALTKGTATVVKVGGVPAGLFFQGEGRMRFLSRNPGDSATLAFNLSENSSVKPKPGPEGVAVEDDLKNVLLWYGGRPLPEFQGAAAEPPQDAFKASWDVLKLRIRNQTYRKMALRAVNAPEGSVSVAEITTKGGRFLHELDEALDWKESFSVLGFRESAEWHDLLAGLCSETLLKGSRKEPLPPKVVLSNLDVDLEATGGTAARLKVVETLEGAQPNQRMLAFDMDSSIARVHKNVEIIFQKIDVLKVTMEDGTELPFHHGDHILLVLLPESLQPRKPVKLRFELGGDFLSRPTGNNYWEMGVQPWFPQPDLNGQAYKVHCRMRVEKPFLPWAPGRVIQETSDATHTVLETAIDKPVCFFAVGAGNFEKKEFTDPRNNVKVRLYGYAGLSPAMTERFARTVHGFIGFYQTFMGRFPFDDFIIVEHAGEFGHGQAPPGMMFITSEAFNPHANEDAEIMSSAWINKGVAHEVAHQYWGHVVKMYSEDDQWLTESFAEYCAALAMRQVKNNGADRFKKAKTLWRNGMDHVGASAPIAQANWLLPGAASNEKWGFRTYLLYDKGPLVLAAVHKDLGDEGLTRFLGAYQQAFAWQASYTQDVPDLLKRLTGKDWDPFFQKYYWGTELPKD